MNNTVKEIYVSKNSAPEPMVSVNLINVIANVGIEGDRYSTNSGHWSIAVPKPDRALTFTPVEMIKNFNSFYNKNLTPELTRRNVLTEGIDLSQLVNKTFKVGGVIAVGTRLNYPCPLLQELLSEPNMIKDFKENNWHLGLNCIVKQSGSIQIGDVIEIINEQ